MKSIIVLFDLWANSDLKCDLNYDLPRELIYQELKAIMFPFLLWLKKSILFTSIALLLNYNSNVFCGEICGLAFILGTQDYVSLGHEIKIVLFDCSGAEFIFHSISLRCNLHSAVLACVRSLRRLCFSFSSVRKSIVIFCPFVGGTLSRLRNNWCGIFFYYPED